MFLTEEEIFEAGVYQLEMTDPVQGGPNGIDNLQAKQLANRTNWLNANKQDKDAILTAIAALNTAADKLIYATGADLFSTTTLTAFARTLLDDADAATMRATIGAQVAGSYQASDATLTAIAALTTAADKLIYATGADLFSTTTLTAFARTLLDDADAATMRATLGILEGIGVGQTWQNVTASRAAGTTYTNSSGRPIMVSIELSSSITNALVIDGITISEISDSDGMGSTVQGIVPNNSTYLLSVGGAITLEGWKELR